MGGTEILLGVHLEKLESDMQETCFWENPGSCFRILPFFLKFEIIIISWFTKTHILYIFVFEDSYVPLVRLFNTDIKCASCEKNCEKKFSLFKFCNMYLFYVLRAVFTICKQKIYNF